MRMRMLLLVALSCSAALPVWGTEEMVEAWRSPFGAARAVALDPRDNSCWAVTGASVMHVSATGAVISQWDGFALLESIALNPTDGSIWVGDWVTGSVIHLSADGTEQWRRGGFREPCSLSVNPNDGSCWVADGGAWDSPAQQTIVDAKLVHLSAAGTELWRASTFEVPWGVSVNPNDGSCWVADIGNWDTVSGQFVGGSVAHLTANGSELWRGTSFSGPIWVSVNPSDNSCWAGDRGLWDPGGGTFTDGAVVHLSAEGGELWRGSPLDSATRVAVDPSDGSCWAADYWNTGMVHLSASGTELWRNYEYGVGGLAVDDDDNSCWVAAIRSVVHLAASGAEVWRGQGFFDPMSVSVNPNDGSCWVGDGGGLARLSATGGTLWRSAPNAYCCAQSVSVDPGDSSVWVAAAVLPAVAHVAANGNELLLDWDMDFPKGVCAAESSCWVAEWDSVTHLAANGTQLWHGTAFVFPTGVSVNPTDGSVWVADHDANQIIHLSGSGSVLWRGSNFPNVYAVAANPNDGSCWAVDAGRTGPTPQVVHLSEGGAELWRGGEFTLLWSVSVNRSDDSCWVGDDSGVVHFASDGTLLWRGRNFRWAESVSVNSTDGSCWVADTGNGQVVHLVLGPPVADFTASPTDGVAPLAVQFSDASSGEPTSWAWAFGDGATSTARNPAHQYQEVGTYGVSLTAANAGGSDTVTRPRFILVTFTDVPVEPEPHWALHQVLACVDAGIVHGYWDNTYRPTLPVDRASMAVYIARALAGGDATVPDPAVGTQSFSDVDADHWAYKYIEYAASAEANVVQGYPGGNYKPDDLVNRGQMAVYIARAMVSPTGDAAVPDPPATPTFPDVTAESEWSWCHKHVEYLAEEEIVQGYPDDSYHPERVVSRDQMAVYVARAFQLPV